jgi:hypothetical protein
MAVDARPAANGPRRYSNQAVIDSLEAGRFSVTDGPAIRIAIDRNQNGVIDDNDVPMGGTFDFFPGDRIPVLVEWLSTPEFGPVARIDLYVGNERVTYAPKGHGPAIPREGGRNADFGNYQPDPSGQLQIQLADVFGRFSRAPLPAELAYHGVARFYLGPAQFQLATTDKSLSYIRAYATTIAPQQAADLGICVRAWTAGSRCGNRKAYSNPVWSRYNLTCPPRPKPKPIAGAAALGRPEPTFVDANGNRFPDSCEGTLPDACRTTKPKPGAVDIDRPQVADKGGAAPAKPAPARPIPKTSCQRLAGL